MTLPSGSRLGPYEILGPLGAGGMGEVYRATDTRLGRVVALKVLPEDFLEGKDRKQRFEREARALASLNHPNIAVLYSFEEISGPSPSSGSLPILTMELLEGESLREVIGRGAVPVRRALEIAEQAARGLAAAHEKGIVHRDVKPENVFLTKDGHVKVIDFGLARSAVVPAGRNETESPTVEKLTTGGAVVGTVAYMSPEQARGLAADHRSDQFSLGIVLYEMLSGRRPFKGDSAAETLTAIIREEPEPITKAGPAIPAPVWWMVERCLAKEALDRYDSTRDLARELASCLAHLSEALSGAVEPVSAKEATRKNWRVVFFAAAGAVTVAIALAGGMVISRTAARRPEPKFQRLTFKRGYVTGARFAPDGRTVVYSAAWDGQRPAVYSVRLDALDSVASGYAGANLLAVSSKSQLALSLQREGLISAAVSPGTLALAPFAGGTPRAMDPDVSFADFSGDGEKLVVAKGSLGRLSVEYPPGNALYKSAGWWVSHVRLSPSGELIAFLEHPTDVDTGEVVVVDRSGKILLRKGPFSSLVGLAWSPKGDEIWFGGNPAGKRAEVRALTPRGRERVVFAAPVPILPLDFAADGRLLAVTMDDRVRLFFHGEMGSADRELSAQGSSGGQAISPDGAWVAFVDDSLKGVAQCYLRSTSGAPPIQLGEAESWKFSADSRTLVVVQNRLPGVLLQPLGPGQPTTIRLAGFEAGTIGAAGLFPDGTKIWFRAKQRSRPPRIWEIGVSGGEPRPLTPEGVAGGITDDGLSVLFFRERKLWIRPISGGDGRPVEGLLPGEWPAAWTVDGKPLFVCHNRKSCPAKIYRLDPKTGEREFFGEIGPSDASGVYIVNPQMSRDGKACVYQVNQILQELHVIEGLR